MSRVLGKKFYKKGQIEEALDEFLAESVDPADDGELAYLLGLCYTRSKDYDMAISYLQRVLEIDFHILRGFQSRMVLAYIFNIQEQYGQAQFHLEELLNEGFESPQIHSSLGYAYWCLGDADKSLIHYKKALDMNENHATTLNSMGYILVEQGERLNDAIEYCQKALSLDPINPNYLDSLGWAYYKAGRYHEAETYLSKACKQENVDELIHQHLAQVKKALS